MNENNPIASEMVVAGSMEAFDAAPRRVFDQRDVDLLANISSRLMKNPEAKALPDVMSFAFWCRGSHLKSMAEDRSDLSWSMGRGTAFHIAPSNVPVNFAFSWVFALLAGNPCIVRVPSKPFDQVRVICSAIDEAMSEAEDTRSLFVSYPTAGPVTEWLSSLSDVRIIWGGDATVSSIRRLPSQPRCVDIAFADRFSIGCIDASKILEADDDQIKRLAGDFYNDTYLMDQNACSSPMTILWLNACEEGKRRFWDAVRLAAREKYYLQGAVATDKYVQMCRDAIDGRLSAKSTFDGWLDVVRLDNLDAAGGNLASCRGKGGYFYELDVDRFEDALPALGKSCQTVTYFGVDPEEIRAQVLDSGSMAVDRIVPIGKAMDIDVLWDGMDLLSMMSRKVDVR